MRKPGSYFALDRTEQMHEVLALIKDMDQKLSDKLGTIESKLTKLDAVEEHLERLHKAVRERDSLKWPSDTSPSSLKPHSNQKLPSRPRMSQEDLMSIGPPPAHDVRPMLMRTLSSKSFLAMRAALNVLGKNTGRSYWAQKVWTVLESGRGSLPGRGSIWTSCFNLIWPCVILASISIALIEEIFMVSKDGVGVTVLEVTFDCMFTVELLLRFVVCPDRRAYFFDPFNYIDFGAGMLPLLLRVVFLALPESEYGHERNRLELALTCITPALRLLKMLRRFEKFNLLLSAFKMAFEALPVLLYTLMIIVFTFSGGIYWFEPRDNIQSFPRAMWFTVVTMSTVGYGDVVPKSIPGSIITAILTTFSALYMAIPIGIVGSAFNRVWEDRDRLLLLHRMRMHLNQKGYDAEDIPELFILFDEDRNGQLSFDEFKRMLLGLKLDISGERLVRLFHAFDANGNGSIDDVEFVRRLFPQAFCNLYGSADAASSSQNSGDTGGEGGEAGGTVSGGHARRRGVTSVGAFRADAVASAAPAAIVVTPPPEDADAPDLTPTRVYTPSSRALVEM